MKAKAYIAYENDDNTYSVYESVNGGEEYWLYDLLQVCLDDDDKRVSDLFGMSTGTVNKTMGEVSKKGSHIEIGDKDVVKEDPIGRDVPERELNKTIPNVEAEIVFVVNEREVIESYIPVNTSPTVIDGLVQETTIKLFDNDVTKYDVLENGVDPIVGFSNNEDVMNVIGSESVGEQFLEQYHRYFAGLYIDMKHRNKKEKWVKIDGFKARIIVDDIMSEYEMVNVGLPIQVTWDDGTPSYKMYSDGMNAYGGLPKVFGSQLRLKIHPEYQKVVKAIQQDEVTEETIARSIQPIANKIIKQVHDNFTDEILFKYVTEAFEENMKTIT